MKETILVFQLEDPSEKLALETVLFPYHVRLKKIKLEQYTQNLGALAGLWEEDPEAVPAETALDAPMLIFAGIPDAKLNQMLAGLRKRGIQIPYKAILTPTNATWTPLVCFEEIRREHEAMHTKN
ncbi:MAG: DUF3783 domain-containing protein [Lachnospiraceae bacterium]|nr:DUF3783 domain-containing protein [Lachnospiraceae bacterium]